VEEEVIDVPVDALDLDDLEVPARRMVLSHEASGGSVKEISHILSLSICSIVFYFEPEVF